jgi:hypothetical protein
MVDQIYLFIYLFFFKYGRSNLFEVKIYLKYRHATSGLHSGMHVYIYIYIYKLVALLSNDYYEMVIIYIYLNVGDLIT